MNSLGTHDTERILSVLGDTEVLELSNEELSTRKMTDAQRKKARSRLKIASTLQYTVFGVPSLYYGDEAGLEGGHDPFCRQPFPWGNEDKELADHYKKLGEISGGERQIVSICSAIIQDTEIVILDEPTSALDIKNQHKVLSIIKEIATEQRRTFILSSHNPNHALFLDSNVMVLQNGKIAMSGNAKETIKKEMLSEVYGENICYSSELSYDEISFKI